MKFTARMNKNDPESTYTFTIGKRIVFTNSMGALSKTFVEDLHRQLYEFTQKGGDSSITALESISLAIVCSEPAVNASRLYLEKIR